MQHSTIGVEDVRAILNSLELTADIAALKIDVPLSQQGIDSLDFASLMLKLEQAHDIKITDAEAEQARTLRAIAALVDAKLSGKS